MPTRNGHAFNCSDRLLSVPQKQCPLFRGPAHKRDDLDLGRSERSDHAVDGVLFRVGSLRVTDPLHIAADVNTTGFAQDRHAESVFRVWGLRARLDAYRHAQETLLFLRQLIVTAHARTDRLL